MRRIALIIMILLGSMLWGCAITTSVPTSNTTTTLAAVTDTTPPVISIGTYQSPVVPGGMMAVVGATCTDDIDPTCVVVKTGQVDYDQVGDYDITFTATDAAGNIATQTITITVIDPDQFITITLGTYETTVEVGDTYVYPTGTCTSTMSTTCTLNIPQDIFNTDYPDERNVIISAEDGAGYTKTIYYLVTIVDTTAPDIWLNGDATVTISVGTTFVDPGFDFNDYQEIIDCGQDITTVDTSQAGTTIITYYATDASGNTATITRTVIVQ
ncbi:MAG: DUF5011 domain-containing protein [Candidatus Izemoplasmatales bacterium]|nr:DUF5011 domain-containing protein [Candidatus Izemoplasmatales bacterium]